MSDSQQDELLERGVRSPYTPTPIYRRGTDPLNPDKALPEDITFEQFQARFAKAREQGIVKKRFLERFTEDNYKQLKPTVESPKTSNNPSIESPFFRIGEIGSIESDFDIDTKSAPPEQVAKSTLRSGDWQYDVRYDLVTGEVDIQPTIQSLREAAQIDVQQNLNPENSKLNDINFEQQKLNEKLISKSKEIYFEQDTLDKTISESKKRRSGEQPTETKSWKQRINKVVRAIKKVSRAE